MLETEKQNLKDHFEEEMFKKISIEREKMDKNTAEQSSQISKHIS